mmetsp:Transcript_9406/g.22606  ORF Transcript_9406/g.22606 Transcript_9406/m.22606 type:complete len:582 (+) Transcript_9406:40-1785(+)
MGGIVDRFWAADESTKVSHGCLTHLQSWTREDLRHTFENFRAAGGHAVNCRQLGQILRISNYGLTKDMFDALISPDHSERGLVDFWSVMGPMVVMSGQHYISRMTFLFSIFDMDGDGCLNASEVILAVRSVFYGLARFFPKASLPDSRRVDQLAQEMFQRFDTDCSGYVSIGEFVNYAYRSEGLLRLCEPFPTHDKHIFEEPVHFLGSSSASKAVGRTTTEPGPGTRRELRLAPGGSPSSSATQARPQRQYGKPWQRAANRDGLTKAHAWIAWITFRLFASKENPKIIHTTELLQLVSKGRVKVFPMINAAVEDSKLMALNFTDDPDELAAARLVMNVSQGLLAVDLPDRLQKSIGRLDETGQIAEGQISLRNFLCLLWPKASDAAVECCTRWCRSFHAHQVLTSLLRQKRASMRQSRLFRGSIEDPMGMTASGRKPVAGFESLEREDLQALFEALDVDGNGKLSARELCTRGGLSAREAQRLLRVWDQDADGELTMKELSSVVQAVDSSLKQQVKGLFAATTHEVTLPAAAQTARDPPRSFPQRSRRPSTLPPATTPRGPPALLTRGSPRPGKSRPRRAS